MLIDVNSVMLPAQGRMHLLLTLKGQDIKGYMYLCVCYTRESTGLYTVFMLLIFSSSKDVILKIQSYIKVVSGVKENSSEGGIRFNDFFML